MFVIRKRSQRILWQPVCSATRKIGLHRTIDALEHFKVRLALDLVSLSCRTVCFQGIYLIVHGVQQVLWDDFFFCHLQKKNGKLVQCVFLMGDYNSMSSFGLSSTDYQLVILIPSLVKQTDQEVRPTVGYQLPSMLCFKIISIIVCQCNFFLFMSHCSVVHVCSKRCCDNRHNSCSDCQEANLNIYCLSN